MDERDKDETPIPPAGQPGAEGEIAAVPQSETAEPSTPLVAKSLSPPGDQSIAPPVVAKSINPPVVTQSMGPPALVKPVEANTAPAPPVMVADRVEAASTPILPRIRLDKKHPLAIRWMHWINFPVLFTMIWSGLLIYWNDSDNAYKHPHEVYRLGVGPVHTRPFLPAMVLEGDERAVPCDARGWGIHFFFVWIFAINGFALCALHHLLR